MAYTATGRLHKVFATEQKSAQFSARDFVIEVEDGKYPQLIKFQLTQDKCPLIDDYSEGDQISVEFDLRGREWNDKYFTNLTAWRITKAGDDAGGSDPVEKAVEEANAAVAALNDFDDEIPF